MGGEGAKGKLKPSTLGWRVIWVPSFATIVPILNGPSWQGGHGKICKVQVENFDRVPAYIE